MASGAMAALALVAIVVIASLVFAQDPYNPTGTYVNSFPALGSATTPANGLSLRLSINATTIMSGQTVNVTVGDYNTLRTMENFSVLNSWPLKGLAVGPCGTLNEPFGVAVFRGYYAASSISSAKALQLFAPGIYTCPAILSGITQYSFYPQSSVAQIWGSCSPEPCPFRTNPQSIRVNGFWNTVPIVQYSYHTELTPGVYTVAAGDEWGQLVLLYFVVKS